MWLMYCYIHALNLSFVRGVKCEGVGFSLSVSVLHVITNVDVSLAIEGILLVVSYCWTCIRNARPLMVCVSPSRQWWLPYRPSMCLIGNASTTTNKTYFPAERSGAAPTNRKATRIHAHLPHEKDLLCTYRSTYDNRFLSIDITIYNFDPSC